MVGQGLGSWEGLYLYVTRGSMICDNFFKKHHDWFKKRPRKKGTCFLSCFLTEGALCLHFALGPTIYGSNWRFPEVTEEDHRGRAMRRGLERGDLSGTLGVDGEDGWIDSEG